MRKILALILSLLFAGIAHASDRVTLTITLTNTPSNDNTLVVNGNTRTWTNAVSTASSQILTASGIPSSTTNLWKQITQNPYSGPLVPQWVSTNQIKLTGQPGGALTASAAGGWATLSYSTQTVTEVIAVRVPITGEPTASSQTNIASLLVSNVFNLGLSTNKILPGSTAMSNFVNTSIAQLIGGTKSFTGGVIFSNDTDFYSENIVHTNGSIVFNPGSTMQMMTNVNIADSLGLSKWRFSTVEATNSITTFIDITNKINALIAANTQWTGTNNFLHLENSTLAGATITDSTYYGTIGALTNGTIESPTINSGVNRVAAFQSYINDSRNLELGGGAFVTNGVTGGVSAGYGAYVGAANGVAVGREAISQHSTSVALGYQATTTAANQIRAGTSSQQLSVPGSAAIGGNLAIGHADNPTFPSSLAKGIYLTNGTAASVDPANGAAIWAASGELQYRTSASSEGAGITARLHNRGSQVVGSGSDYTFTGSYALLNFGTQPAQIDLPTAGTYLILANVQVLEDVLGGGDQYFVRLYNNTASSVLAGSERFISNVESLKYGEVVTQAIVTVATGSTIHAQGKNGTSARGTAVAANTTILYVRLF